MTRPKTARAEAARRAWCDCCERDPSKDEHAKGCPLREAKPAGGDL